MKKKDNKELLDKVIKDRLMKSMIAEEGSDVAFNEAMEAIDRQIQLDNNKKDKLIKAVEISAAVILTPLIDAKCRQIFAKMICDFEKDYTFTTTAGKSLSKLFKL